ncbi:ROK family transcriptional regulator [Halodurantibacterium flavum]|uniref:ROK family protein n=1 Tax=Halodurantibacterium flavum TaxID=1382802 RepID=A0ABW4S1P3_9RHOB
MAGPGQDGQRIALGKNPGRSRSHNRRVVLDLVRSRGHLGRKALADLTQLSTQAVANIIDELLAENLLVDLGRRRSGRGQPPIQFAINPDGAITIGFEVAVSRLVTTVLDLGGNIRDSRSAQLDDAAPDILIPRLAAEVAAIRDRYRTTLTGVGVVMPGPFEIEGLSGVGPTTLPGWAGVDVAGRLGALIGVPVVVENDANAAAVGETLFGAGQHLNSFCVIYFGAGLGLGIIHENLPLRGAFGNAGEIGHIVVVPRGRACACGQRGCLERYASLHALHERLGRSTDYDDLARMMGAGDPALSDWLDEAADHLAPMIAMLENTLDPETVILGGALPDGIIDALIGRLSLGTSVANRRDRAVPRVIRGRTGQMTAALGAAALPFSEALTPRLDTGPGPGSETSASETPADDMPAATVAVAN